MKNKNSKLWHCVFQAQLCYTSNNDPGVCYCPCIPGVGQIIARQVQNHWPCRFGCTQVNGTQDNNQGINTNQNEFLTNAALLPVDTYEINPLVPMSPHPETKGAHITGYVVSKGGGSPWCCTTSNSCCIAKFATTFDCWVKNKNNNFVPVTHTWSKVKSLLAHEWLLLAMEKNLPFVPTQISTKKFYHTSKAMAVLDAETGKFMEYYHLWQDPQYHDALSISSATEFVRLANGWEVSFKEQV